MSAASHPAVTQASSLTRKPGFQPAAQPAGATFTLTLEAPSQDAIDDAMIAHLRAQGYHVSEPNEQWETLSAFMRRIGLSRNESFHESLSAWEDRGFKIFRRIGKSGRIIELLSNYDFDAFCRRNKK